MTRIVAPRQYSESRQTRAALEGIDRVFWVLLSGVIMNWAENLVILAIEVAHVPAGRRALLLECPPD